MKARGGDLFLIQEPQNLDNYAQAPSTLAHHLKLLMRFKCEDLQTHPVKRILLNDLLF